MIIENRPCRNCGHRHKWANTQDNCNDICVQCALAHLVRNNIDNQPAKSPKNIDNAVASEVKRYGERRK